MEDEMESMEEFDPPKHLVADEADEDDDRRFEEELEREKEELLEKLEALKSKATGRSRPSPSASPFPYPVAKTPAPTPGPPPPPPAMDIPHTLKGMTEVAKASAEVNKYLSDKGVKPSEFLSRNSEKVTPLYNFFNDESCASIVVSISVFKGVKTSMAVSAKKLSGAVMTVPPELHPVLASAAFGAAIPEMKEVDATHDITCHFKIGEDLKLKMYYKVMSYTPENKLDSYITILDPELLL